LSKLSETIPDSVDMQVMGTMAKKTGDMLSKLSDQELSNMPEMDSILHNVLRFYELLVRPS
jgi:hypothetical protein